jgi:type II secretion system protein C
MWSAGVNPIDWFMSPVPQTTAPVQRAKAPPAPPPPLTVSGAPVQPLQALPGTDSSISEKPLPLLLSGTVPGRNAFDGTAMMGVSRENMQTYSAGAMLVNGARLREIHERYVVLEKSGRTARLYLQDLKDQQGAKTGSSDLLTVGGARKIKPADATSNEPLTDYLRPNPVYDGAVLRGYEVYPGKRSGAFHQTGLQPGDLIMSIEGLPLDDPAQAFEMFRQLMDGVALTATVSRKGKIERISIDGAAIIADQEQQGNSAANTLPAPER